MSVSDSVIDYRSFLSRHDMTWNKPPHTPFDSPFAGNGDTGINLFFDEEELYINLANTNVYDNRTLNGREVGTEGTELFMTPRLSLGGFRLDMGRLRGCDMRLSLYDGLISGKIFAGKGSVDFTAYVVEGEPAIVFQWTSDTRASMSYVPVPGISPRQAYMLYHGDSRVSLHYDPPKEPHTVEKDGVTAHVQPKFTKGEYSVAYRVFQDNGVSTLIACVGNGDEDGDTAQFDLVNQIYATLPERRKAHDEFWHNFYTNSFLTLDDTMLEGFYWIQLYKCACATRSDKRVFDTAGPWMGARTAWPATWWNLNVELHYSLLYPTNHLELSASLPNELEWGVEAMADSVPEGCRDGGALVLGRDTTSTLFTKVAKPGESGPDFIRYEQANLLWALHSCYLHFSYGCDDEGLRTRLYPLLRGAVTYLLNFLYDGPDGKLHMYTTTSPEYLQINEDCNYSLSLLVWGLQMLLKLTVRFGIRNNDADMWLNVLNRLTDYPIDGDNGFMIAKDVPYATSHRHYSHLLMFYPLHTYTEDDPERRKVIEDSIRRWQSMPQQLEGYSQTGAASMNAVLGNGEKAYEHLMNVFKGFIMPNTMYHEGYCPVLETPPAAARAMVDMLLYSDDNEIRVFSAVPAKWKDAAFEDMLTECGCRISAKMTDGKPVYVSLTANKACRVRLKVNFAGAPFTCTKDYTEENGAYVLELADGETAAFTVTGADVAIAPVEGDHSFDNWFGQARN